MNEDITARDLTLHQRLLDQDPTAPSEVYEIFAQPVLKSLQIQAKYSRVDEDMFYDAIHSAIFEDYILHPQRYKPELRGLLGYLKMAADNDLKNMLAKQKRHFLKIIPIEDVALSLSDRNMDVEAQMINHQEALDKLLEFKQKRQEENTLIAKNETERQLLALEALGEKRTSEWAKVLGITQLPKEEQERIVKREKDKLRLRRKRSGVKPEDKKL